MLNHCDRISSCTPLVKWTEPIHVAVSSIQESCLLFISSNFFSLIDQTSFHEVLKVNCRLHLFLVIEHACRVGFPGANPGRKGGALNKVLFGRGGGGSASRSNPLPFYIPFLREMGPLSYTFYLQVILTSHTYFRTLHLFFTVIKSFGSFYRLK